VPNTFGDRLKHAWNAIRYGESQQAYTNIGPAYSIRPDLYRSRMGTETSIVSSIYTRIGIDVASIPIQHVRLDDDERYIETIESGLNNCLTLEANIDQTGRAFIQDVVMSMCDEGVVAIVPIDTTLNPNVTGSYDISTMRTAKIVGWYPKHVRVNVYNDETGYKQDITLPKSIVAIVENPLYQVMNEPNSTLQRLITKLNLLDVIDSQSGSGKLDLIIQLPYVIKTEARKQQAENRRKDIEDQLKGSKYGIAYTDGTERVTQLNRPAENNLMGQIEFLTSMLYSQLGLTKAVFDGTADEKEMINYYNRSIEPILAAVVDAMRRVFITKTGRTQGQSIMGLRDPFKLVPVSQIADIADKFTRNEVLSSNEIRQIVGRKPSDQTGADELRNKNLNQPQSAPEPVSEPEPTPEVSAEPEAPYNLSWSNLVNTNQNGRSL
jgi:hypothetical protein